MRKRFKRLRPFFRRRSRQTIKPKKSKRFSLRQWRLERRIRKQTDVQAIKARQKGWKRPLHFIWRTLGKLFRLLARAWRGFRWMTRSLWFRLMGAFAIVIILMGAIVTTVVDNTTARAFSQYIAERDDYIRTVIPTIVAPPTRGEATVEVQDDQIIIRDVQIEQPEPPEGSETASELIVSEPNGEIRVDLPPIQDPEIEQIIIEEIVKEQRIEQVITEEVVDLAILQLLESSSPEALGFSFLADVQETAQTAVAVAGFASLILGTILFYQITRPMSQMRRAAQALAAGDTEVRVPVRSQDELGKVAEAFNQMANDIAEQEQLRQQMVADVAHELRTPLTVMRSNLEGMLDGLLEPNPEELGELHDEVQRLSRLIDDLRLLSLADSGQLNLVLEAVDIRQIITRVVALLTPLSNEREVILVDDVPGRPLIITADADRIQQALTNLVANGVRHTPRGGRVRVTAVQEKEHIHLSVIDSGPGISADDLVFVFNRFWRNDKSRSRHSGGSGLGLAIVKQIAELHSGYVTAVSPNNSGATFTISLPINS